MNNRLRIAMILGEHPIDTINIFPVLLEMEGIEIYPQTLDCFLYDFGMNNDMYDGYLFYNMHMDEPDPDKTFGNLQTTAKENFYKLGEDGKGIVVIHHALAAFPKLTMWSDIVGIKDRSFQYFNNQSVDVKIVDAEHPVTRGIADWTLKDETFIMGELDSSCSGLLSTTCENSMPIIAWTKKYKQSNVFCFVQGHDGVPFQDENFVEVLRRGLIWSCCGNI